MLKIDVLTLFPEMVEHFARQALLGQALQNNLLSVSAINPREFSETKHKTVDDRPFGGGDGMILQVSPVEAALKTILNKNTHVIFMSPQGKTLCAQKAKELSQKEHLVFVCGRYGGIDQRFLNTYVNEEISIGDYVLSGGEVAAMVTIEALSRFVPGVLGHEDSAEKDSFGDGLLEHPNFTRPREWNGAEVPEILLSGNHAAIEEWKYMVSLLVTLQKRPDLFEKYIKSLPVEKKNKKSVPTRLKEFFLVLSDKDKAVLGLDKLQIEDMNV